MLNIPRRTSYSMASPRNKARPIKSRLVAPSSSGEVDDVQDTDTPSAEADSIPNEASDPGEADAISTEVDDPVETNNVQDTATASPDEADDQTGEDDDNALVDAEAQNEHSLEEVIEEIDDVAELETLKTPAVELDDQNASDLAELETEKNPALVIDTEEVDDVAELETRKTPSVSLDEADSSDIVELETQKTLSVAVDVVPDSPSPVQDDVAVQATSIQEKSPGQAGMSAWATPKRKRARISRRKKALLLALACMILIPSFIIVFEAVNAYMLYKQMQDGLTHIQNAQALFHGGSGDLDRYFDAQKLRQARVEMDAAHADFVSLSNKLDHDNSVGLAADLMPSRVSTLRALDHIAVVGTSAAQIVIRTAIEVAPSVAPAIHLGNATADTLPIKPYITPAVFQKITDTLDAITPLLHQMSAYAHNLSLDTLPLSARQQRSLTSLLTVLPLLETGISRAQGFKDELRWLLGVDEPRTFLVEPMDRAELRATGGFTGQFGDLIFSGAHIGPLKLSNIGKYEEDHTIEGSPPDKTVYPKVIGQSAPGAYADWWPVGNFGLRDANVSADFPTSAKIAMDRYAYEFGKKVDGVVMFTPTLIKQILHVTGPLVIASYHETISEYNLEERLHYYQLDNKGIRREEIVEHVEDTQVARKLFTQKVTAALFSKVTHLPFDKLLPMADQMLQSMKSKDLQVYVTNPQLEALIGLYGSTAELDRSNNHDGLFIVQSNLSASKASQYVTTSIQDAITLDKKGGANHHLLITLNYQQRGDVYGFDTYRDYLRVYAPVNSQLLAGNGFDQYARPYCGDAQSRYRLCLSDVYGDGSLVCTPPVKIGYATAYLDDPYAGRDHPLDVTGMPLNRQSDEAGRAMFGGWVVVPKDCIMKVTLSWYVPPMKQQPYSLLLQAQAGLTSPLRLAIYPAPQTCASSRKVPLQFSDLMDGQDTTFTLQTRQAQCALTVQ